jgi:hypothetical protein
MHTHTGVKSDGTLPAQPITLAPSRRPGEQFGCLQGSSIPAATLPPCASVPPPLCSVQAKCPRSVQCCTVDECLPCEVSMPSVHQCTVFYCGWVPPLKWLGGIQALKGAPPRICAGSSRACCCQRVRLRVGRNP